MAAYRADIEIGVKGIQQLQAVTKQINSLSAGVDEANKRLAGSVQSINAYNSNLAKAEATLRKVNAGTRDETDAIRQYVQALGQANAARDRQNRLIQEQILLQRKAVPTANAGFGVQGPALPPGAPAARGRQAGGGIGGRIGGAVSGSIIGGAFPLLFGQGGGASTGGAVGGLVGGLAGPGGSFAGSLLGTLIGDIASKGQKIEQLGQDLGFSASQADLLSNAFKTANTDVEKFTATIQNIRGVGLELEDQVDAVQLVTALTEKYGGTWEKIGNAITSSLESGKVSQATLNQLTSQGITIQDALAAKYGVSRDEILKLAKDGDISVQALLDTLVDLGNASVTAAEKVETPFQKAIGETVAIFQDFWTQVQTIFAGVSGSGTDAATKLINIFNTLLKEVLVPLATLLARIAALFVNVVSTGVSAATDLITGFRGIASAVGDAVMNIVNMIPGLRTIVGLAGQLLRGVSGRKSSNWNDMPWPEGVPKPGTPGMIGRITAPSQALPSAAGGGAKGPKPPESRVAQLKAEYDALVQIGAAENAIRDLLFEKKEIKAAEQELAKDLFIIERERLQAIDKANYGEEKLYINKLAQERASQAIAESDDKIRGINKQRADDFAAILRGVEKEIQLTDARINNTIDQVEIDQKISDLIRERPFLLKSEIEQYRQLLELANKRRDAEEVSVLQKQIQARGQGLQAGFIGQAGQAFEQQIAAGKTIERATEIAQLTQQLELANLQAQALESSVLAIGDAFGAALTTGIADLITGTRSAKEVFADFLEGIAGALASAASQIIATYIAIGVARLFAGFSGSAGQGTDLTSGIKQYPLEGAGFTPLASGGFVTGPTYALIGEGGEPEYVIPFSKMDDAMANYSNGARGESVLSQRSSNVSNSASSTSNSELSRFSNSNSSNVSNAAGDRVSNVSNSFSTLSNTAIPFTKSVDRMMMERSERETVAAINNPKPLDVRFESQVINGVEYVTAEQHQRGMAQAAERGRALTLQALQNSVKTRKQVGMA